jgi:hypothetical protein
MAGLVELQLLEALARRRLAPQRAAIGQGFAELALRVAARRMWASVYDQALFVLAPYAASADGAEKAAATALLKQVKALAG